MANCICCGSETNNQKFCSRSCSAKITNSTHPRRKKQLYRCSVCTLPKAKAYHGKCSDCVNDIRAKKIAKQQQIENSTLQQLAERAAAAGVHRSWWYSEVRYHARRKAKKLYPACRICGYEKHVEICHIKAISEFSETTTLKEINDLKNLVGLCPNHHWELDHGLLDLSGVLVGFSTNDETVSMKTTWTVESTHVDQ